MRIHTRRPELRLDVAGLGVVNPFELSVREEPLGSENHIVVAPGPPPRRTALDLAGLALVGAGQALLALSMRWLASAGREVDPALPLAGEVRMVLQRREARLLASLLNRHLERLPQPPPWMPELLVSLRQIEEFFRWETP